MAYILDRPHSKPIYIATRGGKSLVDFRLTVCTNRSKCRLACGHTANGGQPVAIQVDEDREHMHSSCVPCALKLLDDEYRVFVEERARRAAKVKLEEGKS